MADIRVGAGTTGQTRVDDDAPEHEHSQGASTGGFWDDVYSAVSSGASMLGSLFVGTAHAAEGVLRFAQFKGKPPKGAKGLVEDAANNKYWLYVMGSMQNAGFCGPTAGAGAFVCGYSECKLPADIKPQAEMDRMRTASAGDYVEKKKSANLGDALDVTASSKKPDTVVLLEECLPEDEEEIGVRVVTARPTRALRGEQAERDREVAEQVASSKAQHESTLRTFRTGLQKLKERWAKLTLDGNGLTKAAREFVEARNALEAAFDEGDISALRQELAQAVNDFKAVNGILTSIADKVKTLTSLEADADVCATGVTSESYEEAVKDLEEATKRLAEAVGEDGNGGLYAEVQQLSEQFGAQAAPAALKVGAIKAKLEALMERVTTAQDKLNIFIEKMQAMGQIVLEALQLKTDADEFKKLVSSQGFSDLARAAQDVSANAVKLQNAVKDFQPVNDEDINVLYKTWIDPANRLREPSVEGEDPIKNGRTPYQKIAADMLTQLTQIPADYAKSADRHLEGAGQLVDGIRIYVAAIQEVVTKKEADIKAGLEGEIEKLSKEVDALEVRVRGDSVATKGIIQELVEFKAAVDARYAAFTQTLQERPRKVGSAYTDLLKIYRDMAQAIDPQMKGIRGLDVPAGNLKARVPEWAAPYTDSVRSTVDTALTQIRSMEADAGRYLEQVRAGVEGARTAAGDAQRKAKPVLDAQAAFEREFQELGNAYGKTYLDLLVGLKKLEDELKTALKVAEAKLAAARKEELNDVADKADAEAKRIRGLLTALASPKSAHTAAQDAGAKAIGRCHDTVDSLRTQSARVGTDSAEKAQESEGKLAEAGRIATGIKGIREYIEAQIKKDDETKRAAGEAKKAREADAKKAAELTSKQTGAALQERLVKATKTVDELERRKTGLLARLGALKAEIGREVSRLAGVLEGRNDKVTVAIEGNDGAERLLVSVRRTKEEIEKLESEAQILLKKAQDVKYTIPYDMAEKAAIDGFLAQARAKLERAGQLRTELLEQTRDAKSSAEGAMAGVAPVGTGQAQLEKDIAAVRAKYDAYAQAIADIDALQRDMTSAAAEPSNIQSEASAGKFDDIAKKAGEQSAKLSGFQAELVEPRAQNGEAKRGFSDAIFGDENTALQLRKGADGIVRTSKEKTDEVARLESGVTESIAGIDRSIKAMEALLAKDVEEKKKTQADAELAKTQIKRDMEAKFKPFSVYAAAIAKKVKELLGISARSKGAATDAQSTLNRTLEQLTDKATYEINPAFTEAQRLLGLSPESLGRLGELETLADKELEDVRALFEPSKDDVQRSLDAVVRFRNEAITLNETVCADAEAAVASSKKAADGADATLKSMPALRKAHGEVSAKVESFRIQVAAILAMRVEIQSKLAEARGMLKEAEAKGFTELAKEIQKTIVTMEGQLQELNGDAASQLVSDYEAMKTLPEGFKKEIDGLEAVAKELSPKARKQSVEAGKQRTESMGHLGAINKTAAELVKMLRNTKSESDE